ncbi:unnamed protein product [Rotaria sp. Silwood1]|nr:unnamed protein product [Rotaria sp. Silwood1]CAF1650100.1 unnamed protein product [Rotaria sp. Silwood1]
MLHADFETTFKCGYCNMSNVEFKERLFKVTSQDQRRQTFVKQWLEIDMTLLEFIRKYTCIIAHVYCLKMELDSYKSYIDRTQSEYLWLSQLRKMRMKEDNIDENFSETQKYIRYQLRITEQSLSKAITKLINCIQNQEAISGSSVMDMTLLKAYIITFVRQDYRELHDDVEQKKRLLLLKANDVRLVKEFFDLKPNSIQISLARSIWRATIREEETKNGKEYEMSERWNHDLNEHAFNDNKNEFSFDQETCQLLQYVDLNGFSELIDHMDSTDQINEDLKQGISHIRDHFMKENYVLRTSYKGYSLHIFPSNDFKLLCSDYIELTGIYKFIQNMDTIELIEHDQFLFNIVKQVQTKLDDLFCSNCITQRQYDQMRISRSEVELSYLVFALNTPVKGNIYTIRPVVVCNKGPTMRISRYLCNLLWSLFHQLTGCRTFRNGVDVIENFESYARNNYLQSTTLFVTFNIHEICMNFSHEIMIKALEHFLLIYGTQVSMEEELAIETILQLVRLVLENQMVLYGSCLFEQTRGNASGCPLTIPLACIYLCYSQPALMSVLIAQKQQELFGRFQDNLFLTWNRSEDQLHFLFGKPIVVDRHYQSIQIKPFIGTSFHFLDVELSHNKGHLHTRIYHDAVMDQYQLPNQFQAERSSCLPSRLLQSMLMYVVRCCSKEQSFDYERRYLKLVYLLYGFSENFIDNCIEQFYKRFYACEVNYFVDRIPYETLRRRVMKRHAQLVIILFLCYDPLNLLDYTMVDQINQAIDIVVPWMDNMDDNDDDDDNEKIINLSGDEINERRPLYQITRKKYLNIIRQQLQTNNRILLPTYNLYAYYSCELTLMQQKVHEHMTRTGAYRLIMELDQTNPYSLKEFVKKMNNDIMKKLNCVLHNKLITYAQWKQMSTNRSNSQLNTLYFLPDTRQANVPFHPMVRCHHHLTMNISHFLNRLLQPIYDYVTFSTTFNTGADVIDAVERCFDEIFFTWNDSEQRLHDVLHTINRQLLNMPITMSISNDINCLDVNICHLDGNLKIKVVHQLNTEPYSLPYVVGHPRHKYHSLLRAALLRATRCYANVFDFVNELVDIQLSFQYNRFSNDFIIDQIQLFLKEFGESQMNVHGGEKFYDQSLYDHLRHHVFKYHQREKD